MALLLYFSLSPFWAENPRIHYGDVIMGAIASQITSLTIVYSTVYSDADQRKIKASRHWPLCGEFTGDRWIPRTNGLWRGKRFHLMTSSWIRSKPRLPMHWFLASPGYPQPRGWLYKINGFFPSLRENLPALNTVSRNYNKCKSMLTFSKELSASLVNTITHEMIWLNGMVVKIG